MSCRAIVKIYGGLGNQLFQYAFAKAYQLKNKCKVSIDCSTGFQNEKYKREYLLNHFSIKLNEPRGLFFKFYKFRIFRILIKLLKPSIFLNQKPPFKKFRPMYLQDSFEKMKIFQGYWQSPIYFIKYSKIIKKDLNLKIKIKKNTIKESKLIKKNCIALCLRFFQEVEELKNNNSNKEILYYKKAIKLIKKKIKNPNFFVFCNDIKLAKKFIKLNFPKLNNIKYFSEKSKNVEAIQDLYLLTKFNNFILSKSTLHWWGAYLSETQNICIGNSELGKDYFQSNWILI